VRAAEPDVVIDEMTDLGAVTDFRHFDRPSPPPTGRGWTLSRTGSAIKSESDQLDPHPPREFRRRAHGRRR
jgi:hypothetical protein